MTFFLKKGDKVKKFMRKVSFVAIFILIISMPVLCRASDTETAEHSGILFISSYDYDWDSVPKKLQGFTDAVNGHARVDYVFMDTKKYTYNDVKKSVYDKVKNNIIRTGGYSVIVLADDAALDFALEYRDDLFSGIPMVFEGINTESKAVSAAKDPLITGVIESFPMEETVAVARRLYPDATDIVAVSDGSESGQGSLMQYYDCEDFFPELNFTHINCSEMTEDEIVNKIGTYDENTILLFLMLTKDGNGNLYSQSEAAEMITRAAKVPVFKADELGIGDGMLGGVVISYENMAETAGKMALDIISGTVPEDIPVVTTQCRPVFDETVMNRFGIKAGQLPGDSIIINHKEGFIEQYKSVFVPAAGIIGFLLIIIVGIILWNRKMGKYYTAMNEKDIMLDSLVKNIPGGIAIYRMGEQIDTIYYSDGIPTMLGMTRGEYDELLKGNLLENTVSEQDVDRLKDAIKNAVGTGEPIIISYRAIHKGGTVVWVQLAATRIRMENNCPVYYAVLTQISQEAVLYRGIATDSPGGICVCDMSDYSLLYVNGGIRRLHGSNEEYSGKKCYEYLLGRTSPCEFCSMYRMNEKEYLTREMDIPGKDLHVIVRGKIIDWNGRKAHIEYITDDTYRHKELKAKEENYRNQMKLLSKLSDGYVGNYRINITRNTSIPGYGVNRLELGDIQISGSMDGFVANAVQLIPFEEDKKRYHETFGREQLENSFMSGQDTVTLDHRAIIDGTHIKWYRSTAVMTRNPVSGDIEGYIYSSDIHQQKVRQLLIEKSFSQKEEKHICIDINNNADTGSMVEGLSLDTVVRELSQKNEFVVYYDTTDNDEKKYMRAVYSYLDREAGLIALIITDITEIRRQQETQRKKLEMALSEAKAADAAKSDFLSRMSHDMRTPLNAILSLTSPEMTEDADEHRKDEYINEIHTSGTYLLGIINDVLDMSKIESSKMTLIPEPYEQKVFCEMIDAVIGEQCRKKNIKFIRTINTLPDEWINVDIVHFNQIFINLLSNAVKFTPSGGTIEFTDENISQNNGYIKKRFIVRDTGIGMSPEFLPHAFDSFEQENNPDRPQNNQGTGLGLSIVKRLVELMNGKIAVESEQGKGSVFTVELTVELVRQAAANKPDKAVNMDVLKGAHILLFEDHPVNARITIHLLEKKGCIVDHGINGQKGLDIFMASAPGYYDGILMDIRMPVMDGLEATRRIRQLDRKDALTVPIIAMTANAYTDDVKTALDAGMNAHLGKPVEPALMYATLCQYFNRT